MAIATAQLAEPRMFNHRRGLWGYSGETERGTGMVVQSTGMGGPSAAIVCEELADLGAELFLRVGTCGAIDPKLKNGDLVIAATALRDDGASAALAGAAPGTAPPVAADPELSELLVEAATASGHTAHAGTIASVDLFYDPHWDLHERRLRDAGALAIEMEAATVLSVGERRGVRSACLLAVTDELHGDSGRERLSHDQIVELGDLLGLVAVRAVETLTA